jgi:hypothetical protein
MVGTCKENGKGSDAKKDDGGRMFIRGRRVRLPSRWMDDEADLKIMKIKQWIEKTKDRSNGDWLLWRPRLNQACSTERKEGR